MNFSGGHAEAASGEAAGSCFTVADTAVVGATLAFATDVAVVAEDVDVEDGVEQEITVAVAELGGLGALDADEEETVAVAVVTTAVVVCDIWEVAGDVVMVVEVCEYGCEEAVEAEVDSWFWVASRTTVFCCCSL